jgi:SAM-dependent methyltransferase
VTRSAFFTLHRDLPREGPGERGDVAWAAEVCDLARDARICDAACGPGADIPALLFAAPEARLIGFDLHQPFVDDATARFAGDARVTIARARLIAMDDGLPGPADLGPFDLIWCAGAAYFHGVIECLTAWRGALAPGGYVGFSDAVYLTDAPSDAVRANWAEYPGMTDAAGVAARVTAAGFETVATRVLSDAAWEGYYGPVERRISDLKPQADAALQEVLAEAELEAQTWRSHRDEFGYLLSVVRPV